MDNLPELPKYNPLEIDEDVYPIRGINMTKETQTDCKLCRYAPVITFILADIYAAYHGYVHEIMWIIIQLLFASMYIKDTQRFFERKSDGKIHWNTSGIMLVLMLAITLRTILFILLFS
jgi:hypothetical protein